MDVWPILAGRTERRSEYLGETRQEFQKPAAAAKSPGDFGGDNVSGQAAHNSAPRSKKAANVFAAFRLFRFRLNVELLRFCRSDLTQPSTASFCEQFFGAVCCHSNANSRRLVGFWANQLAIRGINRQFHVQSTALWAFGIAAFYVLVNLVHAFNHDLALFQVDRQNGSASSCVISSNDFYNITFADLHYRNSN